MCGRYTLTTELFRIQAHFGAELDRDFAHRPRYNVAPTQEAPIVTGGEAARILRLARFGLIPHWAPRTQEGPKLGARMINARSETVAEKPAFRDAFRSRHCLVPADSFIEWREENGKKQPYRFLPAQGELFALAGIHERWISPEGRDVASFAILTRDADPAIRPYHDRMPVILPEGLWGEWLRQPDRERSLATGAEILRSAPAPELKITPISTLVNSPRNDMPEALEPVRLPAEPA